MTIHILCIANKTTIEHDYLEKDGNKPRLLMFSESYLSVFNLEEHFVALAGLSSRKR
jgi:hypothetical protein